MCLFDCFGCWLWLLLSVGYEGEARERSRLDGLTEFTEYTAGLGVSGLIFSGHVSSEGNKSKVSAKDRNVIKIRNWMGNCEREREKLVCPAPDESLGSILRRYGRKKREKKLKNKKNADGWTAKERTVFRVL